ncbi:hypothetical protein ACFXCR_24170, partial [Streptomyces sp. NPDC059431]
VLARPGGAAGRVGAVCRRSAASAPAAAASWAPYWRPEAVDFFRSLPMWNIDRLDRAEVTPGAEGTV